MALQQPYIYDPSKKIGQNLKSVAEGVTSTWEPIIQKRINDYNTVKGDLDNIEKIKSELSVYHRDILNKKAEELQRETAGIIRKNGTIDIKAKAQIDDKIRQLKNLHQNSLEAGTVLQEFMGMAKDNASFITDMAGLKDELYRSVREPESLVSGAGLRDKMMKSYSKNLNIPMLVTERFKNAYASKQLEEVPVTYTDKDGNFYTGSYKAVPGMKFNPETGRVEPEKIRNQDGTYSTMYDGLEKSILKDHEKIALSENNIGAGNALHITVDNTIKQLINGAATGFAGLTLKLESTRDQREKDKAEKEIKVLELADFPNKLKREERKTVAIEQGVKISGQNAIINAKRLGLSIKQYKQGLVDNGYEELPDGSFIYSKSTDTRESRADKLGSLYNEEPKTTNTKKPKPY